MIGREVGVVLAPYGGPDLLLEVRDLRVTARTRAGDFDVLSEVSLSVKRGEIVGVVGESGSGKTTLARAVIGLLPPNFTMRSSTMTFAGRELSGLSESEWCTYRGGQIGMIFQDPESHFDPVVRVGVQIEEAIHLHDPQAERPRDQVLELLQTAGIDDAQRVARAYPFQLSGGLQQRALIALALAGRPRLLLADEPTSSLDVVVQRGILGLLRRIADQGLAVLLVTHDLAIVSEICDTVYVLYAGRLAEYGPADRVIRDPIHPYSRGLLEAGFDRGADPVPIPGSVPRLSEPPPGCRFHPRCPLVRDRCRSEVPLMQRAGERGLSCWVETIRP